MYTNIDKLKTHVENLTKLLNDPQPGLLTWQMVVHKEIEEIAEFQ